MVVQQIPKNQTPSLRRLPAHIRRAQLVLASGLSLCVLLLSPLATRAAPLTARAQFVIPIRLCPDPTSQVCVWSLASTSGSVTLTYTSAGTILTVSQDQSIAVTNHADDWLLHPVSWVEHKRATTVVRSSGASCYVWTTSGSSADCFTTPISSESWFYPINPNFRITGKHILSSYVCCTYVLPSNTPATFQVFP